MKPEECPTTDQIKLKKFEEQKGKNLIYWKNILDEALSNSGINPGQTKEFRIGTVKFDDEISQCSIYSFIDHLKSEGWKNISYRFEDISGSVEVKENLWQWLGWEPPTLKQDLWERTHKYLYVTLTRPTIIQTMEN